MKTYISEMEISRKDFDRINRLMEIDFDDVDENGDLISTMAELVDELDARPDTMPYSFCFEFEDESTIYIDICSGSHNYYDNCFWVSKGKLRDCVFDCHYMIEENNAFVPFDGSATYICKFIIVED